MFPGIRSLVARLGERVRVRMRVGNLTMTNHPIHIHGIGFEVTGTDGGPVPKTAGWPEVTTDVAVGQMRHEPVIGTTDELPAHAELMKPPNMEHDEPYMAHVSAGRRGEITWTSNRHGDFEFACLIPGHDEAGMRGTVHVTSKP